LSKKKGTGSHRVNAVSEVDFGHHLGTRVDPGMGIGSAQPIFYHVGLNKALLAGCDFCWPAAPVFL